MEIQSSRHQKCGIEVKVWGIRFNLYSLLFGGCP